MNACFRVCRCLKSHFQHNSIVGGLIRVSAPVLRWCLRYEHANIHPSPMGHFATLSDDSFPHMGIRLGRMRCRMGLAPAGDHCRRFRWVCGWNSQRRLDDLDNLQLVRHRTLGTGQGDIGARRRGYYPCGLLVAGPSRENTFANMNAHLLSRQSGRGITHKNRPGAGLYPAPGH